MWRFPSDEYLKENGLDTTWEIFVQTPLKWVVIILGLIMFTIFYYYSKIISINDDFDTFFNKFYVDSTLQMNNVKFPLKNISTNGTTNYITKQGWKELGDYNLIVDSKNNAKEFLKIDYVKKDSINVIFELNVKNIDARVLHKFKKIDNKWFLIEVEDKSKK
ncbi:DUF4348 domain-containing protein [Arcicella sp. DC2W]|uniref:DUF4348 domain-containing protein n=1 Tax=Arcicella gelida TaxID=2984195 RepID=A0ABU5SBC5_9BACT|nr:DUF4348 domain-containing protein [Arcicella sp. DC2W]MEA5405720.1 DUF4348 domain-containing protein [Arcicella sp. DC2W]